MDKIAKVFIITFIVSHQVFFIDSACSPSLLVVQNKLFLLSDDQLDANEAEDRCNDFEASLATISDATIDRALKNALSKYTKDLTRLFFYHQNVASKKPIRASRTQINDRNWISLKGVTDPWFIDFYAKSSSDLKALYVCTTNEENWIYGLYPCSAGKIEIFKVYGRTNGTSGFKALYLYRSSVQPYKLANILLSTDRVYGPYITRQHDFYVPVIDRNVFIGARYNTNNGTWLWSNGSVANYNTQGLNRCQQKALHYGNDWELVNKECSGRKEYYVCQVNFLETLRPFVEHDVCDATTITIRWNDVLEKMSRKINKLQIKVEVVVLNHPQSKIGDYFQLSANITNLQPQTNYTIQVKAVFGGCSNAIMESSLHFKTPLGVMDPVTGAKVILQSGCFVQIPAAAENPNITKETYYEIVAKSTKNVTSHLFAASTESMVVSVPLSDHGDGERVEFTIKAKTKTCFNEEQSIQGYCISPGSTQIVFSTHSLCNSSILNVSWPESFAKTMNQTGDSLEAKIDLKSNRGENITQAVDPDSGSAKINILQQGTSYSAKIVFIHEGSNNFTAEAEKIFVTANRTSEVVSAKIISSNPCLLRIQRTKTDLPVLYHVKTNQKGIDMTFDSCANSLKSDNCVLKIPLDQGQVVEFQVKVSTCAGSSAFVRVEGNCTTLTTTGSVVIAAIGSTVVVLLVILLVVVVLLKRRNGKRVAEAQPVLYNGSGPQVILSSGNKAKSHVRRRLYGNLEEINAKRDAPAEINLFDTFLKNSKNSFVIFIKDFDDIPEPSSDSSSTIHARKPENVKRNRYKNILPYDHARVVLEGNVEMDYINASYIPGFTNSRKFIASQGPKPSTIHDFWMMIWQQGSTVIVMLANLTENGKPKCERYWPLLGKCKRFNDIRVSTTEENRLGGIIQRKLTVIFGSERRFMKQFHYDMWPDHGIPATTSNMMYLRRMVEINYDKEHPIIVHCSAGAGRTGTYIAMDYLFDQLDAERKVDVKRCVTRMRENRMQMVQNVKQYCFVYKLILEHEQLPNSDQDAADIQRLSENELASHVQKECNILENWRFGEKWQENKPSMQTYSNNAISIWRDDAQQLERLNASNIQDFGCSGTFIAAQVPQDGMHETFWKMISMKEVGVVVCLEKEAIFWALDGSAVYGSIQVDASASEDHDAFSVVHITLSSTETAFEPVDITLIHVVYWNQPAALPSATYLIKVAEQTQIMRSSKQQKEVVVCCQDGCGKTGTLIAIITILERLKIESRVDVMRTVKDLRDMRPNMVNEKALYLFCYTVVLKYLSSFSTYANYR